MELPELSEDEEHKLKEQHPGGVVKLTSPTGHTVYFKPVGLALYAKFSSEMQDEGKQSTAQKNLVAASLVSPDQTTLKSLLEDHPALVVTYANALMRHAGMGVAEKKVL